MATNKESNFISAVVYLKNDAKKVVPFFSELKTQLDEHFKHYEIVAVNDGCTDDTVPVLKNWAAQNLEKPLTVLNMSLSQGIEPAMNAGLDIAIGDFVYEFDCMDLQYDAALIWQAYEKALTGFDIVTVCPNSQRFFSKSFYRVFNACSNTPYTLQTDVFRLVSRRGINRVHSISAHLPYRKAAYAASGLACATLTFAGKTPSRGDAKIDKAMDSLALYTNAGYKASLAISVVMLAITLFSLVYTVVIWLSAQPVQGWTTTMLVLSVGLTGLFAILTIVVKYLNLILNLVFKKQNYLIEGIEKIQK